MGAVRSVSVAIKMQVQDFVAGGGKIIATTKAMSGEMDTLAKTNKAKFNDVTKMAAGAGLAMIGIAAFAVKAAYDFDKQMSEVQAVSNATATQFESLRDAAIEAGKATQFSATDAAKAEAELAKAGVSTSDILHGALSGSLSLAAAGQMDLADAATISAQAMNIFGLKGSAVTHIADVLASAANASAADMQGLGDSLKQGGLIANQTGLSLEDTVGVLAAFADHALIGSDAGTSLKSMLQALQAPSKITAALMEQLGINAYDTSGKFIGITALAQNLQDKLKGLTQEQRDNALAQIFGSDATRSATILYNLGAKGVQNYIDKVDVAGTASKTAAQKMNNLSGDVEQLKGSFETLAIESGGGVTSGLRKMTESANAVVGAVIDMPPVLSETLTILSGVSGVALLAATGFQKAKVAGHDFLETLSGMGPAGETAATGLGKVGGFLGKAGLWGAAAFAAYEGVNALFGYLNKNAGPTERNIDGLTTALAHFADTGESTGELAKTFGKDLSGVAKDMDALSKSSAEISKLQSGLSEGFVGLGGKGGAHENPAISSLQVQMQQAKKDFAGADEALTDLQKNGQTIQATSAFTALSSSLGAAGYSVDQITALFPKYSQAAEDAAASGGPMTTSLLDVKTATGETSIGLEDLIEQGNKLKDVLGALSAANESYAKQNIGAEQALADLSKALDANAKNHIKSRTSLSASTQAGRDNLNLILASIDADQQQFQGLYAKNLQFEDSTSALKDATAQYDTYIGRLRTTLLNEGFNKTAVDALIRSYGAIPPVASTTINTPGLDAANVSLSGYSRLLSDIPPKKTTKIDTTYTTHFQTEGTPPSQYFHGNRWGGAYEHAAIGTLRDASMYGATSPGRYMIAEPQTGGEAFVPKRGDYGRSMSILNQAAGWYGASVVPGGMGSGGGGQVALVVRAEPGAAAAHMEFLRIEVERQGSGDVQRALGRNR